MKFSFLALVRQWVVKIRELFLLGADWEQVFGFPPDIYPEPSRGRGIAEFKGVVYVTADHIHGLQVWRSIDGYTWEQCVGPKGKTPAGFGNPSRWRAGQMAVLNDTLFLGTDSGVWTTEDGDTWEPAAGEDIEKADVLALAPLGDYMYAVANKTIWRGKGTTGWQVVVGDRPSVQTKAGFGDPDITDITSLTVLGQTLYAGAGLDNPSGTMGIAVWRTNDGKTWQQLRKETGGPPRSLHVHAMAPFLAGVYIGGYHVLRIYRTSPSQPWADVTDGIDTGSGNDAAWSMATFASKLYLGALGVQNGKILWETADGTSWAPVDTKALGLARTHVDALLEFNDHLYVTTSRAYLGPMYEEQRLEIWRYTPIWGWPMRFFKPWLKRIPLVRVPRSPL